MGWSQGSSFWGLFLRVSVRAGVVLLGSIIIRSRPARRVSSIKYHVIIFPLFFHRRSRKRAQKRGRLQLLTDEFGLKEGSALAVDLTDLVLLHADGQQAVPHGSDSEPRFAELLADLCQIDFSLDGDSVTIFAPPFFVMGESFFIVPLQSSCLFCRSGSRA